MLKKLAAKKNTGNIGVVEIKISLLIVYSILMGVMGVALFTFFILTKVAQNLANLFICESLGSSECSTDNFVTGSLRITRTISFIMLFFLPVVIFMVIFSPQAWKKKLKTTLTSSKKREP